MADSKEVTVQPWVMWALGLAMTIIGFLGGVGTVHLTVKEDISENDKRITVNEKSINVLERGQITREEEQTATLKLLTKLVDQNNFLIQKLVAGDGKG